MGSLIYLRVGKLEVDWGKNSSFSRDHAQLFQPGDWKLVEYTYVDEDGSPINEKKPALGRTLRSTVSRLELLGHTLKTAKKDIDDLIDSGLFDTTITFKSLLSALVNLDPNSISGEYDNDYSFGEFGREIAARLSLKIDRFSISRLGEFMENIHPWTILRLLAERPQNLDLEVVWYYEDVVESGWAKPEEFQPSLPAKKKFLLVTEGSSDSSILRKAFAVLMPEISDFFYFVDMEEGYPFTGTGNMFRFAQGLASIKIANKVVMVFDNDAEGVRARKQVHNLSLPPTMLSMQLPNRDQFRRFPSIGPSGTRKENINGKAAALECYLDLNWKSTKHALIRWSSFIEKQGIYQGVLISKEGYVKKFLELRANEKQYDFSGLQAVLASILKNCVLVSTSTDNRFF